MEPIDAADVKEEGFYWRRENDYDPDCDDTEWDIVRMRFDENTNYDGLWMWCIGDEIPRTSFDGKFIGPLKRNESL